MGSIGILCLVVAMVFCFVGASKPDNNGRQLLSALAVIFFIGIGLTLSFTAIKNDYNNGSSVINLIR